MTFTKRTALLFLALANVAQYSFAIAHSSSVDPQLSINAGQMPGLESVGFFGVGEPGSRLFNGSGVAVENPFGENRFILTAAHIFLDDDGTVIDNGAFGLGTNDFTEIDFDLVFEIESVTIDDEFTAIGLSDDIAIVEVDREIPDEFLAIIFEGEVFIGQEVVQAGFGLSGTEQGIADDFDGLRRAAVNQISDFGLIGVFGTIPEDQVLTTFLPPTFQNSSPLAGVNLPGDSGGGFFVENKSGELELVGITGFEIGAPSLFSSSGATLIGPNLDFVNGTLMALSVPEPAGGLLLIMAVTLVGLTRSRSESEQDCYPFRPQRLRS